MITSSNIHACNSTKWQMQCKCVLLFMCKLIYTRSSRFEIDKKENLVFFNLKNPENISSHKNEMPQDQKDTSPGKACRPLRT